MKITTRLIFIFAFFLAYLYFSMSCRRKEYDLNQIDTTVNIGGDSLMFPIGSTDTMRLDKFLKIEEMGDFISILEDGSYALAMADSMSMDLPLIDASQFVIEDLVLQQIQDISLDASAFEDLKIPGFTKQETVNVDVGSVSVGGITIPNIQVNKRAVSGIWKYALTEEQKKLPSINKETVKDNCFPVPPAVGLIPENQNDQILSLSDPNYKIEDYNMPRTSIPVQIDFSFPEGVNGVDTIYLQDAAALEIELSLDRAALASGAFSTNLQMDISDLFILKNQSGTSIDIDGELSEANQYKVTKTYPLSALYLGPESNSEQISVNKTINTEGVVGISEGATIRVGDARNLSAVSLNVRIRTVQMNMKDMKINTPPLSIALNEEVLFNFENDLPEQIEKIETVFLKNPAQIVMQLSKENMQQLFGIDTKIKSMQIEFPPQLSLKPQANLINNTFSISEVDFSEASKTFTFDVDDIDLSLNPPLNGVLSVNEQIRVAAEYEVKGRVSVNHLPTSEASDAAFSAGVQSNLTYESAKIKTQIIQHDIETMNVPIDIDVMLDASISRVDEVLVDPGTAVTIQLELPSFPMPLSAKPEGIVLQFPSFIEFEPGHVNAQNAYILSGELPATKEIILPIKKLKINKDLDAGRLVLQDQITVSGGVQLAAASVMSTELDDINNKTIKIMASMPDIAISEIALSSLGTSVKDSVEIEFTVEDFPKEIHSLDSILLKNTKVSIQFSLENLPPSLDGKDVSCNFKIHFPKDMLFHSADIKEGNILEINKILDRATPSSAPTFHWEADVSALLFDGKPFEDAFAWKDRVKMEGDIRILMPNIVVDDFVGRVLKANIDVKVKDIDLDKVYGRIDYALDPQVVSIAIDNIPDLLKGDSVVLDFSDPRIIIDLASNIGIPIAADMKLIPFVNGAAVESGTQTIHIDIPKSPASTETKSTKLWIANKQGQIPSGYTFVQANLSELLKRIPDSIQFRLEASPNMDEQHLFELNANYTVKIDYDLQVPLSFGSDFSFALHDTIKNLPSIVSDLVRGKTFLLYGEVASTLPIDLDMELVAIDSNYRVIPIESTSQKIKASTQNGVEALTPLEITLKDPQSKVDHLYGFFLVFRATVPEGAEGISVKESSYVRAKLKARLIGGITVDISEIQE